MKRLLLFVLLLVVSITAASRIPSAAVDRVVFFKAVDPGDLFTPETGLTSFTVYYSLDNAGTATVMTTPTTVEMSSANMDGMYSLLVDESGMPTLTAGHDVEDLLLRITHASMADVDKTVEVYRPDTTEGNTQAIDSNGRNDVGLMLSQAVTLSSDNRLQVDVQEFDDSTIEMENFMDAWNDSNWPGNILGMYDDTGYAGGTVKMQVDVTAMAANVITSTVMATSSIGSLELAANCIGSSEIATNAIGALEIATGAIDADAIAANAIGASEMSRQIQPLPK